MCGRRRKTFIVKESLFPHTECCGPMQYSMSMRSVACLMVSISAVRVHEPAGYRLSVSNADGFIVPTLEHHP